MERFVFSSKTKTSIKTKSTVHVLVRYCGGHMLQPFQLQENMSGSVKESAHWEAKNKFTSVHYWTED